MTKQEWLNMGYTEIIKNTQEEITTLYKKFENGNMWIVQFNEEIKEDEIGCVYLMPEQVKQIFG